MDSLNPDLILQISQVGNHYYVLSLVCRRIRDIVKYRIIYPLKFTLARTIYSMCADIMVSREYLDWAADLYMQHGEVDSNTYYRGNPLTVAIECRNLDTLKYYYINHRKKFIKMSMSFSVENVIVAKPDCFMAKNPDIGYDCMFLNDKYNNMPDDHLYDVTVAKYLKYLFRTYGLTLKTVLPIDKYAMFDSIYMGPLQVAASVGINTVQCVMKHWKLIHPHNSYVSPHIRGMMSAAVKYDRDAVIHSIRNEYCIPLIDIMYNAINFGNIRVIKDLISIGYCLEQEDVSDALYARNPNAREYIVSLNPGDPKIIWPHPNHYEDSESPWHSYASNGDLASMIWLWNFTQCNSEHPISKILPQFNSAVFCYAVFAGDIEMIVWLHSKGCPIQPEICEMLEYDMEKILEQGYTTLIGAAIYHCDIDKIDWLAKYFSIDMSMENEYTELCLKRALYNDNVNMMKYTPADYLRRVSDLGARVIKDRAYEILDWLAMEYKLTDFMISAEEHAAILKEIEFDEEEEQRDPDDIRYSIIC